jgi:hypothetical protein
VTSGKAAAKRRKAKAAQAPIDARAAEVQRNLHEFMQQNEQAVMAAMVNEFHAVMHEALVGWRMRRIWPRSWYWFPHLREQEKERWLRAGGAILMQREAHRAAARAEITKGVPVPGTTVHEPSSSPPAQA